MQATKTLAARTLLSFMALIVALGVIVAGTPTAAFADDTNVIVAGNKANYVRVNVNHYTIDGQKWVPMVVADGGVYARWGLPRLCAYGAKVRVSYSQVVGPMASRDGETFEDFTHGCSYGLAQVRVPVQRWFPIDTILCTQYYVGGMGDEHRDGREVCNRLRA